MDQLNGYRDDDSIPSIVKSVEISKDYPLSIEERYFKSRFAVKVNDKDDQDYRVLIHSNNLCILSLAPTHPLLLGGSETNIKKIDFQVSESTDRLKNMMTGKGKRGAQIVQKGSTLCKVYDTDGNQFNILSPIPGKLVEINSKLVETPNIMYTHPKDIGFIAIILPQKQKFQNIIDGLMTMDEYKKYSTGADDNC